MQYLPQTVLGALLGAGILAVCGCSTQQPSPAHDSIASLPFSVVATGDSSVDMGSAATFAWAPWLQQADAGQRPGEVSMDTLLQAAISKTLQEKGYRYSAVPGEGDLIVVYQVTPAAVLSGQEPASTNGVQLQPGLNLNSPDPARYQKGTLVIEVTEKSTGRTAWRSALQGFAVRELGDTERRQRIGLMVDRMLAGMPGK